MMTIPFIKSPKPSPRRKRVVSMPKHVPRPLAFVQIGPFRAGRKRSARNGFSRLSRPLTSYESWLLCVPALT